MNETIADTKETIGSSKVLLAEIDDFLAPRYAASDLAGSIRVTATPGSPLVPPGRCK